MDPGAGWIWLKREDQMKKGIHPQSQWISYVTQSGRLINVIMTKIHQVGKVYHIRARKHMAQSVGQIAKYKRRYEQQQKEEGTGEMNAFSYKNNDTFLCFSVWIAPFKH